MAGSKHEESDVCLAFSLAFPESLDVLVVVLDSSYELRKTELLGEVSKKDWQESAVFFKNNKKPGNGKHNEKRPTRGKKGRMEKDSRMNKVASGFKSMANGDATEQKNNLMFEYLLTVEDLKITVNLANRSCQRKLV